MSQDKNEGQTTKTPEPPMRQEDKPGYRAELEHIAMVGAAYQKAVGEKNYALAEAVLPLFPDRVNLRPFYAGLAISLACAVQDEKLETRGQAGDKGVGGLCAALREYFVEQAGPCLEGAKKANP